MTVQRWAQNIRATFTTGSSNVVILGSLWESWVPGAGRRAGCRMMAPGTAYKRLRSHCHLCCQHAINIWRRLTATTVNSSCDLSVWVVQHVLEKHQRDHTWHVRIFPVEMPVGSFLPGELLRVSGVIRA